MKFIKGITIIFGITMIGEFLNVLLPLPIPSGVYGLFLLLGALCLKAVKLEDVEEPGGFFLDAAYVYSCRRRIDEQLGRNGECADSSDGYHRRVYNFCHGCDRKDGSAHYQKK